MMVDSDPTDRADTTDRAGTAADTEAKPTGRKAWRRGPVEATRAGRSSAT